ncbi:hypothetical protein C9I98_09325 [Photobacterium sanctipauli]|uniref:Uncharacterized protein n=2 Tax=Photobacterium sanctipauli TaxID=1342794 RepID=A0A2T3NVH1_9GAMM|nr:hypothetical protein C9I98_09325 [Photobacterium sanctipauli]
MVNTITQIKWLSSCIMLKQSGVRQTEGKQVSVKSIGLLIGLLVLSLLTSGLTSALLNLAAFIVVGWIGVSLKSSHKKRVNQAFKANKTDKIDVTP